MTVTCVVCYTLYIHAGVQVGFDKTKFKIKESNSEQQLEVCVSAKYLVPGVAIDPFSVSVKSHPILAGELHNQHNYDLVLWIAIV